MDKTLLFFCTLIGSIALVVASFPELSDDYSKLTRAIICLVFAYMTLASYKAKNDKWMYLLVGCAALYNPFVPVRLSSNLWLVVNLFAIPLIFVAYWKLLIPLLTKRHKGQSVNQRHGLSSYVDLKPKRSRRRKHVKLPSAPIETTSSRAIERPADDTSSPTYHQNNKS